MFEKIFKKKPKLEYVIEFDRKMPPLERVMVFSKIVELSKQYMSYDYVNNKRKFIEKEKEMEVKKVNFEELVKMIKNNEIGADELRINCKLKRW